MGLIKLIQKYYWRYPYFIFVSCLTLLATLPKATSFGLGGDGQFYAVIALNMSEGLGSFWNPHFSSTLLTNFNEHPPLGIALQAIVFYIFGDHFLVEKLYSVATLLIVQVFLVLIWFKIFKSNRVVQDLFYVPLLFFILIPTVTYAIGNNLLENTMGVFTIMAMYCLICSIDNGVKYIWILFAALLLVMAILTKGPVAGFLLAFYPLFYLSNKDFRLKTAVKMTIVFIFTFIVILALSLSEQDARDYMTRYLNSQILGSIKDGRGMASESHFDIVWNLLQDLLVIIVIVVVMFLIRFRSISRPIDYELVRKAVFFFLIGVSASIPSMLSLKQNVTYIVACYPYFALGFAVLIMMMIKPAIAKINTGTIKNNIVVMGSTIGIVAIIVYSFSTIPRVTKQENYYFDAVNFSEQLKSKTIVGLCSNPVLPWDIYSFFARYYRITLDSENPFSHKYLIATRNCNVESDKFILINKKFRYLMLYQLSNSK